MNDVRIRKVRRICGVKGCRNKDSYSVFRSAEPGFSVIMCADCIKAAYGQIFTKTAKAAGKGVKKNDS